MAISERLAWSETGSSRARDSKPAETHRKRISHARSVLRDLDIDADTKAELIATAQADPEVQQALQRRLRERGSAPAAQSAPRRSDTRFTDGALRATSGLDLMISAAKAGAVPQAADELIEEIASRLAKVERAIGKQPGASGLRRVK